MASMRQRVDRQIFAGSGAHARHVPPFRAAPDPPGKNTLSNQAPLQAAARAVRAAIERQEARCGGTKSRSNKAQWHSLDGIIDGIVDFLIHDIYYFTIRYIMNAIPSAAPTLIHSFQGIRGSPKCVMCKPCFRNKLSAISR